jgi:hypothetical protein
VIEIAAREHSASKPAAWYAVVCFEHDIPRRAAD